MKQKSPAIVITTINSSQNAVLQQYDVECISNESACFIIGDKKTPVPFDLKGAKFFDVQSQSRLDFKLAQLLPFNHYSRKNLGYLLAIQQGHDLIMEVDDDNIPLSDFWLKRSMNIDGQQITDQGWTNVYRLFSDKDVWPRGFPLEKIDEHPSISNIKTKAVSPVQQFLADEDPDVDAVFRLYSAEKFQFKKNTTVILPPGAICPFNSQSTLWFRPAFPLLYLPSTCSFRMCDIWRSYVAQRIMRTNNWQLSFHSPTVRQERNDHDLYKDLEQELEGYLYNEKLVQDLDSLDLVAGEQEIFENMKRCYEKMIGSGYLQPEEMELLMAWINDIKQVIEE